MTYRQATGTNCGAATAALALFVLMLAINVDASATDLRLGNGLRATIHDAEDIAAGMLVERDGSLYLDHPRAGALELRTDGDWYPFARDMVAAALAQMDGFTADLEVDVFILPAPPLVEGTSFARRGVVFLAPGFAPVDAATVAYVATHEMGHVLTWSGLDGRPGRWDEYLAMRNLDPAVFNAEAAHAWRPREVLAEDFRYLFGGSLATRTGSIENRELPTPDRVAGLRQLLAGYASSGTAPVPALATAFPNPCNPRTTIRMAQLDKAAANGTGDLRIYDIRGRLVRRETGGMSVNGGFEMRWDGTDQHGGSVASGRYLYVVTVGKVTARGNVTLVR